MRYVLNVHCPADYFAAIYVFQAPIYIVFRWVKGTLRSTVSIFRKFFDRKNNRAHLRCHSWSHLHYARFGYLARLPIRLNRVWSGWMAEGSGTPILTI